MYTCMYMYTRQNYMYMYLFVQRSLSKKCRGLCVRGGIKRDSTVHACIVYYYIIYLYVFTACTYTSDIQDKFLYRLMH